VVGQTSNIVAKTINSFIIGKTVHEYFCKGQKPGALMAATTVFALGLSASNVYSDWKNDAKLSRQQRSIFWNKNILIDFIPLHARGYPGIFLA
jgi:hypothetical protein